MTCCLRKTLSLILLSTAAHDRGVLSYSIRRNFLNVRPVLLLDVRIVVLFVRATPFELNTLPVAVAFQMVIDA